MKKLTFLLVIPLLLSCDSKKDTDAIDASFVISSSSSSANLLVAFTYDSDSLWTDPDWVKSLHSRMVKQSERFNTILLFSSKENTPDVTVTGINFPEKYDKYMVSGYWNYTTGKTKFCWGGLHENGNFKHCKSN